jgi:hypothetical protein
LEDVTLALNEIESSSYTTNKSALNNRKYIEEGIGAAEDINKLIEISRRNFDLLKVSFNLVKSTVLDIRADFSNSLLEAKKF